MSGAGASTCSGASFALWSLLTYFLRRGDPVGVAGQLFGVVVYARNLFFIRRRPFETADPEDDRGEKGS